MPTVLLRAFVGIFALIALLLSGCLGGDATFVPVIEGRAAYPAQSHYSVKRGETLYAIAWRYGLDYRDLAKLNQLSPPYVIKAGQRLRLRPGHQTSKPIRTEPQPLPRALKPRTVTSRVDKATQIEQGRAGMAQAMPLALSAKGDAAVNQQETALPAGTPISWHWPVRGAILNYFGGMNKGIDIAGKEGAPIKAAAAGRVVYCGNGLRGYGGLIIIKHNEEFLTAYAHNRKMLVKEGQKIAAEQVIAEMGSTEAPRVMLHFEIRRAGKPVDPLLYLSSR